MTSQAVRRVQKGGVNDSVKTWVIVLRLITVAPWKDSSNVPGRHCSLDLEVEIHSLSFGTLQMPSDLTPVRYPIEATTQKVTQQSVRLEQTNPQNEIKLSSPVQSPIGYSLRTHSSPWPATPRKQQGPCKP